MCLKIRHHSIHSQYIYLRSSEPTIIILEQHRLTWSEKSINSQKMCELCVRSGGRFLCVCSLLLFAFAFLFGTETKPKCIRWKMKIHLVLNWFDFRRYGSHRRSANLFLSPEQTSFFCRCHNGKLFKIKHSCLFGCFLLLLTFSFVTFHSNENVIAPFCIVLRFFCRLFRILPKNATNGDFRQTTLMEALMTLPALCVCVSNNWFA